MTGADVLVKSLYGAGVRVLFGMPGSHTVAIYDAIERHGGIRTILIRNEQAGAFAADGYARATGQPGVVCTTAGPGATNALTGIGEAWADSVPLLLVTGQVNHDRLHEECGNYHEIDLEAIFRPCTVYAGTAMSVQQVPEMVAKAWEAMTQGRPRPAALILPQDLMAMEALGHVEPTPCGDLPHRASAESLDIRAAQAAVEGATMIANADRPVILAGGGAVWADAGDEIRLLAERLDCPVLTSQQGKGILDERHSHALGHARSLRGRAALAHADAILAIGCRFTEVMTGFRKMQVPQRMVQIDINPGEIGMNYPAQIGIVGDAKLALQLILREMPARVKSDWSSHWAEVRAAKRPNTEWLIDTLRAEIPDDAVVFTDASEMAYRMQTDFPAYRPRSLFYPSNYIALGWGFPAAIGAAVGFAAESSPSRLVVSFSGDGGFLMTCQELATAVRYRLPMIILIHNDQTYGAIKNLQRLKHEQRYRDTDLNNPDFLALAAAFGIPARRTPDAEAFRAALREAQQQCGPFVIEIPDTWRYLRH